MKEKLKKAKDILEAAIRLHSPKYIFGLFSGGHDSCTVTHFVASVLEDRMEGVVHINTGIGIPQTRQYVRDTCKHYGWNLLEYKATENTKADGTPDPMIYENLCMRFGFPGAYGHRMMYNLLKERQLRRLSRDYQATPKQPIMLISGCRREESIRRMGTVKEVDPQGRNVWVSPFADMTAIDCADYMQIHQIKRNSVKDLLHMSGECLCGAFAHKGELEEIELWYPEVAARIKEIEQKVREAGFPWGWEENPPVWWSDRKKAQKSGQHDAFEKELKEEIEYLCMSCPERATK